MNQSLITCSGLLAMLMVAGSAGGGYAQDFDVAAFLQTESVTVTDTEYRYDETVACTSTSEPGVTFQVRTTAVAPVTMMSRDRFVETYSVLSTALMMERDGGEDLTCAPLTSPIGTPEMTMALLFAPGGMQISITSSNEPAANASVTMTWAQLFGQN